MRYYIKPYLPIIKTPNYLKIGVKLESLQIRLDEESVRIVENLVKNGIEEQEINGNTIYELMLKNNMLTVHKEKNRKEMFVEYSGAKINEHIYDKRILVLGAGGMGSTTSFLLAQFGFKNITIVDFDIVEMSEIEKMVIYRKEHLKQKKVQALKNIIEENFSYAKINSLEKKITSYEDLFEIIEYSSPDFVLKAMDPKEISFRLWLNKICFDREIPFLNASYSFEFVRIGPMFVPGKTACDSCCNLWFIEKQGEDVDFGTSEKLFHNYIVHPAISFNINVASNIALKDIIYYFCEKHDYVNSLSRILDFKVIDLSGQSMIIEKHPECQVCVKKDIKVNADS